jgi:hypothetical protein
MNATESQSRDARLGRLYKHKTRDVGDKKRNTLVLETGKFVSNLKIRTPRASSLIHMNWRFSYFS